MRKTKNILLTLFVLSLSVFAFITSSVLRPPFNNKVIKTQSNNHQYYQNKIQPILNNRCVICHSCYNSPCQLNLASYQGVARGANKHDIYDQDLTNATAPTRLFIDAKTSDEWQEKYAFFSVISPYYDTTKAGDKSKSIMHSMLLQKNYIPFNTHDDDNFDSENSRSCPNVVYKNRLKLKRSNNNSLKPVIIQKTYIDSTELEDYFDQRPWAGMPYGLPKLPRDEFKTLIDWLEAGAAGNELSHQNIIYPEHFKKKISKWENFFNKHTFKHQLSARYIYEHLFAAHIYFKSKPDIFFRLIRAKNRENYPLEIATVRPYDAPANSDFYYRLVQITSSIVHKTHITYEISDEKFKRFQSLFITTSWPKLTDESVLPTYGIPQAANPFTTFKLIPADSRYRFLLDNAHFFIMSFIRGPVCRGQVAVNVIEDRYFVFFIDPASDLTVTNTDLLTKIENYLTPPAQYGGQWNGLISLLQQNTRYRKIKNDFYNKKRSAGLGLNDIWMGDEHNDSSLFTILRHFDSAGVHQGLIGESVPKTVWVVDYTILEDIFYNLVSGYNVFDSIPHHVRTRLYMETSRINAQDHFLQFLPQTKRKEIRKSWNQDKENNDDNFTPSPDNFFFKKFPELYLGNSSRLKMHFQFPFMAHKRGTLIDFKTKDYQRELICQFLMLRTKEKIQSISDYSYCQDLNPLFAQKNRQKQSLKSAIEKNILRISAKNGSFVKFFPELSFVKIKMENNTYQFFSISNNREHFNNNFIYNENERRDIKNDTLTVSANFLGSYPNFFFEIQKKQLDQFITHVLKIDTQIHYNQLTNKYGINRRNPIFWEYLDSMHLYFKRKFPIQYGLFDLNRYIN